MYDFSFNHRNLARELRRSDFNGNAALAQPDVKSAVISQSVGHAARGFTSLMFDTHTKNSKTVYDTALLSQDIVLRKLRTNIKILTRVRQADRDEMITSLRALLGDGSAMRIYKLDLRSFYESIDRDAIESRLASDFSFPASSLFVFRSFSAQLKVKQIPGLPRGLPISETLAEYAMRAFDRGVQQLDEVYYYGRYVDDIVILTTGKEDKSVFLRDLRRLLPHGLSFNQGKCRITEIGKNTPHKPPNIAPTAGSFDFLGYQFHVSERVEDNRSAKRLVHLDIAPKKVKRMKTRLILAMRQFIEDDNYPELIDRMKVLTGNYTIYDFDAALRRKVGLGFNYRFVDAAKSQALLELDRFASRLIAGNLGPFCMSLSGKLTTSRRRQLLKFRFSHAFKPNTFHHLNSDRVAKSISCWKHV